MWFKNLQIYRLPAPWQIGIDALSDQLSRACFHKCPSNQPMSRGWVAPRNDGNLVYSVGTSHWLIALRTEERILPASAVNLEASERAEALAEQQGYTPGRKQMREIKERIIEEFMPRAFLRQRTTLVWIDPVNGWLAIDTSTQGKADEVIVHLRRSINELPIKALRTNIAPMSAMADWLAGGEAPTGFTIDCGTELQSVSEDRATVKYARGPLNLDQVKEHLATGKLPKKLEMTWCDRISFVLNDALAVNRLSFLDLLKDQAQENAKNTDEQFDADFALMTGELSRFIPDLLDALGGEAFDLADQGSAPNDKMAELNDRLAEVANNHDIAYSEAKNLVINSGRASVSYVQRHLRIGYAYAARLIERMEEEGVVTHMDNSGNRKVIAIFGGEKKEVVA